MKVIAATGHRPQKLGGFSNDVRLKLMGIACEFLINEKPDKVMSGMALGWDMAFAEAALELKIPVLAVIPFNGQEARWPRQAQDKYRIVVSQCETFYVSSPNPWGLDHRGLFKRRNVWMVNNCTSLCAMWDGSPSGTSHCINCALRKGIPVVNLWNKMT